MSITVTGTTYNGTATKNWLTMPITKAHTFTKRLITVHEKVDKKLTFPRFKVTGDTIFQNRVLIPTASVGAFETDDNLALTPKDCMVYIDELNPIPFERHWDAETVGKKYLVDRGFSPTIENLIIANTLNTASAEIDRRIWMGREEYGTGVLPASKGDTLVKNVNLKYYNGVLKQLLAPSSGAYAIPSPTTLTKANILDVMADMIKNLFPDLLQSPNVRFCMNPATAEIYKTALRALDFKGINYSDGTTPRFDGYEVVAVNGITDKNTIVLGCFNDNYSMIPNDPNQGVLHYGCNNGADESYIKLDYMQNNSRAMFVKMEMKEDVLVTMPELVVYHTTLTY